MPPTSLTPMAEPSASTATSTPSKGRSRLPASIRIAPCLPAHMPALRRLNALLLPVRYPDGFYDEITGDQAVGALTRVAVWAPADVAGREGGEGLEGAKVVGGIRCRLEHADGEEEGGGGGPRIYVQTLAVLAPYRGLSVATHLLTSVLRSGVRAFGAQEAYAHVWERNEDALRWYEERGFARAGGLVEGYYRRLKPGGAWVVRRVLGVQDTLGDEVLGGQEGDQDEKQR
ncbi:MAG: hypothetical protein M1832_002742 [Thelocarpon impressellum]|nr:MAG: hypothetical protein M1832_002742 [Thelocarpon impressellum]